jgi:protein-disulfide isomerase
MSSRAEQKAAARQARLQAEAEEAARATRVRRVRVLIGVAAVAVLAVVIAIAVSSGGSSGKVNTTAGGNDINTLFEGIPQRGLEMGAVNAPATLEEFVDLQCPFCAQFSREALPTLVNDYVRTGKVKVILRPRAFIGPDSVTAAQMVVATARQNKAWNYADTFYANQKPENSNYVTDKFLRSIGNAVPGLNVDEALKAAKTDPKVTKQIQDDETRATTLGSDSTPDFYLTKGNGKPVRIQVSPQDYAGSFKQSMDAVLGQ